MAVTIGISDAQKSISITVANPLRIDDPAMLAFLGALESLPGLAGIDLIDNVYVITRKDGRVLRITLTGPPLKIAYESADSWRDDEIERFLAVVTTMGTIVLTYGVSAMTITYA